MNLNTIEPTQHFFRGDGSAFPNNSSLPVLIYSQVVESRSKPLADHFEARFSRNCWTGCWRWGVYDFHHFHSNAHEALGIARGQAKIQLGGPHGDVFKVEAGDLIVLPAGTGHKNLGSSQDFLVVGAYPLGQDHYTTSKGSSTEYANALDEIRNTPLPKSDPYYGDNGPLIRIWTTGT